MVDVLTTEPDIKPLEALVLRVTTSKVHVHLCTPIKCLPVSKLDHSDICITNKRK